MADLDTARLCEQIVLTHFGPLTAKIASVLLTRGRLPLPHLVRFTSLKPQTVRASILVLIQHNLAWHAQSEEGGEMIEFNVEECLLRLRFGRFVWLAEELFGRAAAEIVSVILDHGKLRLPDAISRLSVVKPKENAVYSQMFRKLVAESYIKPSTTLHHISPRDKLIQYEAEAKKEIKNFPTAKELKLAKEKAEARFRREEAEAEKVGLIKRKAQDHGGQRHSKKRAVEGDGDVVDDNVHFRLNAAKFNIHIRNRIIEAAVRERYNDSAALVIRAALKVTESKQLNLAEARSDPMSLANIAAFISDDDDLAAGLIFPSKQKKSTMPMLKEYIGMLAEADNPTVEGRASAFVSFLGNTSGKVQVEFETICTRLRRRMLETIAREQYGDNAVRIIRFLLDNGKHHAEHVAKVLMTADKIVRPLLTTLSASSFVSVQEIARAADRNPQRTFYLWHVDLHKAYSVQLGKLYKTLYNIMSRRQAEEEDPVVKSVLEKMQRSDVQADPMLLSRAERDILKEWEVKREKLMVLEMRVEEAVFVLRDLGASGSIDG